MITPSNRNIFPRYWLLVREIPKANGAAVWCFLWSAPEQTVEQAINTSMILDAMARIMTSLSCHCHACCSCSMPKCILESFENTITQFSSSSVMLTLQCQCRCFRRPLIVMMVKSVVILMIWYIITTQIQANRCYYHPCTLFRRWITPYEASCCVGLRNKRNMWRHE